MEVVQDIAVRLEKNKGKDNFINNMIWNTVNSGIDIGLKHILPDFLENEIIDIKNKILNTGIKNTFQNMMSKTIEKVKNVVETSTDNIKALSETKKIFLNEQFKNTVADFLDLAIKKGKESEQIEPKVSKKIENEKNNILSNIEQNVENNIEKQIESLKNLDDYIDKWNLLYSKKDFSGMQKIFNKIEKEINNILPLENTIKKVREIENIQNLIKNNGQNFNISEAEIELAKKLNP